MLLWEALLELLYPSKCVLCGKLLDGNETNLCGSCRRALRPFTGKAAKPALTSSVTVAYAYEDPLRQSLLRYKFQGRSYYAGAYGAMLGMQILREHLEFDVITWVPVSRKRRRKRGYDQAELLAKATARELGRRAEPLLEKFRDIPPQSGIQDAARRKANVLGVYRMRPGAAVQGKRVLLIDDILTTGATLGEAARVLMQAGAGEVQVAVLAAARK